MTKIAVVGLGKAGLPLACVIADSGLDVLGVDVNQSHADKISKKINPIPEEPGVQEILDRTIGKNFSVTTDPVRAAKECGFHIVIVPLFIDEETKQPDFSILRAAFTGIAKGLKKGDCIVLETTVPPGTTEGMIKDLLEKESRMAAGKDFHLAYSPERIMTGYSISRYKEFPKVVGGLTGECTRKAFDVYSRFCKKVEMVKNARTAELVKVSEGVYRDVNIGLANELYRICEKADVDFWEMKDKANHAFCHIHEPGNIGGHCIPVYPWFLINNNGFETGIIRTARDLNDSMVAYYAGKAAAIATHGKMLVIGLSYREGVKEKAYTRSIPMIKELKKRGYHVYGLDPMYDEKETKQIFGVPHLPISKVGEMDAIILMNKNTEYRDALQKVRDRVVDVKNIL